MNWCRKRIMRIMYIEMKHGRPELSSPALREMVRKDNFDFNAGGADVDEIERAFRIVEVAKRVVPAVCDIDENKGKSGVVMAITKKETGFPLLTVQIGEVDDPDTTYGSDGKRGKYTDFANRKALVLQLNPDFVASSENHTLPEEKRMKSITGIEIPGGAIVARDWIISVSAFKNPNMDAATAIAIAAGAGLIGIDEAERFAHDPRVNCPEFMLHEDKILVENILH